MMAKAYEFETPGNAETLVHTPETLESSGTKTYSCPNSLNG